MFKKSLCFVFAIIVIAVSFIGCGSSDSYELGPEVLSSASSQTVNGEFLPPVTEDGTTIKVEKDTFSEHAVVSIIEKVFEGTGSDYLTNSDKSYEIRGILKSNNPLEANTEISSVEKPVSIVLKNNIAGDIEARYVGVKSIHGGDWSFTCVDNADKNNAARAYYNGADVVYNTNTLNIEIALFAKVRGSDKLVPVTVVDNVDIMVASEEDASGKNHGKIKINNKQYDDNLKVGIKVSGSNVNYLAANDFIAEVTYLNNHESGNRNIAGADAGYEELGRSSGKGDKCVHKVYVREFNGNSDALNFTLKTKGISLDEFPMDFSVVVKNSDKSRDTLPFNYSDNLKMEELATPKAPVDIMASSDKIRQGGSITITWKPGEESEGLTYDVVLTCNGSEEFVVAENISETTWTSAEDEKSLEVGSYTYKIVVKNVEGQTSSSEKFKFEVVPVSNFPEVQNLKSDYAYSEPIEINWIEVTDPLGESVKYTVEIEDKNGTAVKTLSDIASPTCVIESLEPGLYSVEVTAVIGENEIESGKKYFAVLEPLAPEIPSNVKASRSEIRYGDIISITWDVVDSNKYNLYLDNGTEEKKVAENLTEGMWTSASGSEALPIANYAARVEAVNNFGLTSSAKPVRFVVTTNEGPAIPGFKPMEKTDYFLGESVKVAWDVVEDPRHKPVTYNLWLYNDTPSETPTVAGLSANEWTFNHLATGTYFAKISATNGEDVSGISEPISFAVIASTVATLDTSNCRKFAGNYVAADSEFIVAINEKNVDETTLKNSVIVTGIDESKVIKNILDDGLHITFDGGMPYNQPVSISMSSVKDIYGHDVTTFADYAFTVIPFPGNGTEDDPFILGPVTAMQMTSSEKLPLIASLTVDFCGAFAGIEFQGADISADDTLIESSQIAEWQNLSVIVVDGNPIVDIPYNRMWLADANGSAFVTFNGLIEDSNYFFKTTSKEFTSEDGLTITLGNGSAEKPYFVYTPQQLNEVKSHLGAEFKQMRNISIEMYASGAGWQPVGNHASTSFTGVYDGDTRIISGLTINDSSSQHVGFFGSVAGDAVVRNITLDTPSVIFNTSNTTSVVGVLAAYVSGNASIENCRVDNGTLNTVASHTGGLIGEMNGGSVSGSSFTGNVTGKSCVGGLIGAINGDSSVENSYFNGNVIGNKCPVAGFVATVYNSASDVTFNGCYSDGSVNCLNESAGVGLGGFVGLVECSGSATFENSYSKVDVVSNPANEVSGIGGFVGSVYTCSLNFKECGFNGTIDSTNAVYVGGFMGITNNGVAVQAEDCYAVLEDIKANTHGAGFAAYCYSSGTFTRCFAKFNDLELLDTTAYYAYAGGFMAYSNSYGGLKFNQCYSEFNTITASQYLAGFIPNMQSGTINNCYASGTALIGSGYMGGFIGVCDAHAAYCYSTADIVYPGSPFRCGTFIGQAYAMTYTCCFSTVELTGSKTLSGSETVSGCYTSPSGYNSGWYWDSDIWDNLVDNSLPTLKGMPVVNE